jgi:hypothetical protein
MFNLKYEASIPRNATVTKPATNEMMNGTPNDEKIEMLIDQTPKEKEKKENPSRPITF